MNYNEALEYIHKINWVFCNPGLDRIKHLCNKLGNPQKNLKFIHVAGTNGKGSFCAMLSNILTEAGYKTGLFTSPYIKVFNERMAIDGEMISNEELTYLTEKIKPIADEMEEKPTEFELITALAFEYFSRNKCEYVVLECGLGGRLDSTNIIENPVLSVITGIALDHTAILGDTVEKIAFEKAGIIKRGVPCLWCGDDEIAEKVIKDRAREQGSPFYKVDHSQAVVSSMNLSGTVMSYGAYKDIKLPLLGEYQVFNASNVLTCVCILRKNRIEISEDSVRRGLLKTKWHARFEVISETPLVIADGGHNPQGVDSAVKSVKRYFGDQKLYVVSGVMADKDTDFISDKIGSIASKVYCITPDNPRALSAERYAELYRSKGIEADYFNTVRDAVFAAMEDSLKSGVPLLCVGSLYMYLEIWESVKLFSKNKS